MSQLFVLRPYWGSIDLNLWRVLGWYHESRPKEDRLKPKGQGCCERCTSSVDDDDGASKDNSEVIHNRMVSQIEKQGMS